VEDQVVVIYAGTNGWVDDIPVSEVRRFESEMLAFLHANHADLLAGIRSTGAAPDEADLKKALEAFKGSFVAAEGG
ncbi:MAG TPA: F0F1 ATP synthase subunit alpha, partial [Acidimicrobiales bacterium]|nr:F0F1 ATP synthase subunit alpha [Acidimicrobiales bacterium]